MAREEVGKPVYEKFKTLAGTIGEEYVRTVEETRKEKVFLLVFTYLLELPLENGWEW